MEGALDGKTDGLLEGALEGTIDGLVEGVADGETDGLVEGVADGETDGCFDGSADGDDDGVIEGLVLGTRDGFDEGADEMLGYPMEDLLLIWNHFRNCIKMGKKRSTMEQTPINKREKYEKKLFSER